MRWMMMKMRMMMMNIIDVSDVDEHPIYCTLQYHTIEGLDIRYSLRWSMV